MSVEWELVKENVEPLKQGRNMSSLNAAININNCVESNAQRDSIRKEFEAELRTYSGDDPLHVYYKYILWLEQNYPLGETNSKLSVVIENCISTFYSQPKYANDARLCHIFLKFIKQVDNPLELFSFFNETGFASKQAEFFINWSFHLENSECTKKANEVLCLGLKNNAEPKASLTRAQNELQSRVAKAIVSDCAQHLNDNDSDVEICRKPLNKISKKGVSKAPINRIVSVIDVNQTNKGLSKKQLSKEKANKINKALVIYNDENDSKVVPAVTVSQTKPNNVKTVTNQPTPYIPTSGQENELKPQQWCNNLLKQNTVRNNKPNFEILADNETNDESAQNHRPFESNALKVRKKNENSPPLARFEKPNPLKKFMFDEKKIYAGGEEFSFEEIRGRKWLAAKNKEVEDARNRKLVEEVSQLRQQIALLLSQQNRAQASKSIKEITTGNNNNVAQIKQTSSATISSADSSSAKSMSNTCESKGDMMSMIRELWNGTLANNEEQIANLKTTANVLQDSHKNHKILIYSDDNEVKETLPTDKENIDKKTVDENENDCGFDAFSIALPKNEDDFIACCASTPMVDKRVKKFIELAAGNNIVNTNSNANFVGGMTAKLSPIVETSREYNSKSSSSSGTSSSKFSHRYRSSRSEKHSRNTNA